ncbi:MAG TPA: CDP-alcohol phosphatidyltransferase family protein [Caulobacteraceae bacterium]
MSITPDVRSEVRPSVHSEAKSEGSAAPGRPAEIESISNRLIIHPASRALATVLTRTPVTPNQVSVSSVVASGAAAWIYLTVAWPWNAILGLAFQALWHVLDGADGDLARRTGRASPVGELVDGICDHLSQVLIYVALALMAERTIGGWAWVLAWSAGAAHFVQANAYETGRKAYRHFVYGAAWMRQTGAGEGHAGAVLAKIYLTVSHWMSPGEDQAERAMLAADARARQLYRETFAPVVKASGLLNSNTRTLAAFLAVLVRWPAGFFIFELTVLNLALAVFAIWRWRANARLAADLSAPAAAQAAAEPN